MDDASLRPSMTTAGARPDGGRRGRIVGGALVAVLFMGSTLLTPLYDLYKDHYRLSAVGLGLLYAVYVLGNLAALLFLGRLSDQLGRRPIALAGLLLAALSMALFLLADGPVWLFVGRVVSGCAVGVGAGAAAAWIAESTPEGRRQRAASTMTAFNFAGLTLGPLLAGALVQYAPAPLRLPFVAYLVLAAFVGLLAAATPETLDRARAAALSLKPRLGVPAGCRLAFIAPAAAGFSAMAVVGYFAALGPSMIREAVGVANRAVSAAMVAELFAAAALAIVLTRRLGARAALLGGLIATPPGLGLLVLAQGRASMPLMLLGETVCAAASALSYRGGLAVADGLAPPERRAEVASSYFICCFLGNALPIIGVAALSQAAGARVADAMFALLLSLLAAGAVACVLAFSPPRR